MDQSLDWIVHVCVVPTLQQGALISAPLLISGVVTRLCVFLNFPADIIHALVSMIGMYLLWFFYSNGLVYFVFLSGTVYVILISVERHRGMIIATMSVVFLLICETYIASPMEWHQVRGSFLVMVMRMVSLGFDLEPRGDTSPKVSSPPSFGEYMGYCLFPTTSVFGPFLVFSEHMKFLDPSPLISNSWVWNVSRAWLMSMVCLAISSCFMPFLFSEPHWNKWLAAYSAAASFRYSHYFVSVLSEFGALASGIGRTAGDNWSEFRVVRPLAIELPRSLGTVVTNWNLPMHVFLKNYVYLPARMYIGKLGAVLATYFASALLHGLNFQLGAVLLSIGIYAYIENVLRYKMSLRLDACVLDRPCPTECRHTHKNNTLWVFIINAGFTALAMFHLAYLGLMFGSQSPEERDLELQGFSMTHTLRKWAHLGFLSHWVAFGSYLVSLIL